MLKVTIPEIELYDEDKNEFFTSKRQELQLEHSLVSLSKWESKWCKPFFSKEKKCREEYIDYIRCMTLTQNVDPEVYNFITPEILKQIENYIDAPMTATTFNDRDQARGNRETITSEIIYYWMIAYEIPFECQKWHLNRLLTLIRVCSIKNGPQKKMSKKDIYSRNSALNAARRQQFNTKG
jgi:hypothetical protein